MPGHIREIEVLIEHEPVAVGQMHGRGVLARSAGRKAEFGRNDVGAGRGHLLLRDLSIVNEQLHQAGMVPVQRPETRNQLRRRLGREHAPRQARLQHPAVACDGAGHIDDHQRGIFMRRRGQVCCI